MLLYTLLFTFAITFVCILLTNTVISVVVPSYSVFPVYTNSNVCSPAGNPLSVNLKVPPVFSSVPVIVGFSLSVIVTVPPITGSAVALSVTLATIVVTVVKLSPSVVTDMRLCGIAVNATISLFDLYENIIVFSFCAVTLYVNAPTSSVLTVPIYSSLTVTFNRIPSVGVPFVKVTVPLICIVSPTRHSSSTSEAFIINALFVYTVIGLYPIAKI